MGLIAEGYAPPPREDLDDNDESTWRTGLDGKPEDPWKWQICIVLQDGETDELVTYSALSPTAQTACDKLLRHCQRVKRLHPGGLALVRLRTGSFVSKHRGVRVTVPAFVPAGHVSADSASKSDDRGDFNDPLPW
jgi:hypothetical protein